MLQLRHLSRLRSMLALMAALALALCVLPAAAFGTASVTLSGPPGAPYEDDGRLFFYSLKDERDWVHFQYEDKAPHYKTALLISKYPLDPGKGCWKVESYGPQDHRVRCNITSVKEVTWWLFGESDWVSLWWGDKNTLPHRVYAGSGNNTVFGGDGDDLIFSGSGDDYLLGKGGDDTIHSGGGRLAPWTGGGKDWIMGGNGNDHIYSNDGVKDKKVSCGPGYDSVSYDTFDPVTSDC